MADEISGPVILINKFNVESEGEDKILKAWEQDATEFKQQAGFISTQLHKGLERVQYLSITQFGNQ